MFSVAMALSRSADLAPGGVKFQKRPDLGAAQSGTTEPSAALWHADFGSPEAALWGWGAPRNRVISTKAQKWWAISGKPALLVITRCFSLFISSNTQKCWKSHVFDKLNPYFVLAFVHFLRSSPTVNSSPYQKLRVTPWWADILYWSFPHWAVATHPAWLVDDLNDIYMEVNYQTYGILVDIVDKYW